MLVPTIQKILSSIALCLAAVPILAAEENQTEAASVSPTYEEYLTAKIKYCLEVLNISKGIHDKSSADAAVSRWEEAESRLHTHPAIVCYVDIPTKEEQAAAAAHISSISGNENIFRELEAEKIRLSKAYYYNSESLAFLLAGDPMCAYPCVPATPDVLQLFTAEFKMRLLAHVGVLNLAGGPGCTPETAWRIAAHPENEKAIERYITRKARLKYSPGMLEADGFRFNLTSSGRQRMEDGTYLFHIYRVIPNSSTSAYQLKQYFRIETVTHEKPSVKSETEILSIAAREFGHDMKGYTARYEVPYYYVELTDFDEPMTLGGGPALKINAYTGEIIERYFTE